MARLTPLQRRLLSSWFDGAADIKEMMEAYKAFSKQGNGHFPVQEQTKESPDVLLEDLREMNRQMAELRATCIEAGLSEEELDKVLEYFGLKK